MIEWLSMMMDVIWLPPQKTLAEKSYVYYFKNVIKTWFFWKKFQILHFLLVIIIFYYFLLLVSIMQYFLGIKI